MSLDEASRACLPFGAGCARRACAAAKVRNVLKIMKDDDVIVIAGRDKGRRGEVLEVRPDGRLIVSGVHLQKKHQRGDPNQGRQGGIISREGPIQASNVAIWNEEQGRADRVGFRIEEGGVKVRYFKSTGKALAD